MTPILDAVRLGYNQAGLCLLPTTNDGMKRPDVSSWMDFKTTRPTVEQMRAWNFATRSGFGLIGGAVSGYVDPWDFDCLATFEAFVAGADACGLGDSVRRIRTGCEMETPGGGRRWLVRYPSDLLFEDVVLAARPGREAGPVRKVLIEITLFSVLAPSNGGTHQSGKPYRQLSGGLDTIASYSATERAALFTFARSFDQMPVREYEPMKARAQTSSTDLKPGDDFNRRASWPDVLPNWTEVYRRGDVIYLRRPGKDRGISATINALGTDRLHVFSSSTLFEADTSYSKFGTYATVHHGGDFRRAALALARAGYGQQDEPEPETRREPRPTSPNVPATGASWRWLRDVKREYVDWLWLGRLARGTLSLWIGDGGLGKSRASNDVTARVTMGTCWPDGGAAPLGAVVILSAEDSPSHTIRPAIEAAGGDLSRVAILEAVREPDGTERTFQLATDLAALEQVLDATDAVLVVIDPLSAYFGIRLDSYRDTDVRAVLEPIVRLAERRQLAVLGIMHVGKANDRQARHRALGSVAFVNAARLVFAIGPDPEDAARRLLVPIKANVCKEAPALAFRLVDADGVPRVAWEDGPVADVSADTVLSGKPHLDDDECHDADALLRQLLEDEAWPLPASSVADAGRAHGIHVRSLQRAAHRIGITIRKSSFRAGWLWFRPAAEDDTTTQSSTTGETGTGGVTKTTAKTTEDVSVGVVSSSADLSPSAAPKTTLSSSSSSSKQQQKIGRREDDSSRSTRAREGEPFPTCLAELMEPDVRDPIGAHDEES